MIRLVAAAALFAATPALADERSFPVGGFDRIDLGGSPQVTVTTGRQPSVRATGSARALDRLDIRVQNGVLKIGSKRGFSMNWSEMGRVTIAVTAPMVRGVEVGGSGSVNIDRVKVAAFSGDISGSGSIRVAALDTGTAKFDVAGSGSVAASGRCDSAALDVAGSGSMQLAGLRCTRLSADIAGSGDIDAFASRTATIEIAGSGDVRVAGGARCTVARAGSGRATCTA